MDTERILISKAAQTGRIQNLLAAGVRDDHFADEELQNIFRYMADHAMKYRQAPSFHTVREAFPLHNFEVTDESVDYLRDEFVKLVQWRFATDAVRELAMACDDDSLRGNLDVLFLEKARELAQVVPSVSLSRFKDMEGRIHDYEDMENAPKGIKLGIPVFDDIINGVQPHEYITISGWTGTGKSTLAQWMLFNAWRQGKTPMYISLEMEKQALFRKWDTMLVNYEDQNPSFLYNDLKSGKLDEVELNKWRTKSSEIKEKNGDIIVLDDVRGCTVDRVFAELHRWQPDICCIDYISLMDVQKSQGNAMWEKITYITQALKQISRTLKIPIIGVAQTNRGGATDGSTLDNIAYSMSIIQDSDLVFGLWRDDDMKEEKRMEVRLMKNRDGMTSETDLRWDMSTMTFEPWDNIFGFKAGAARVEAERAVAE